MAERNNIEPVDLTRDYSDDPETIAGAIDRALQQWGTGDPVNFIGEKIVFFEGELRVIARALRGKR